MDVSVRKLKDNLSAYLRRVQAGEPVIVTDHGRPVAALVSLSPQADSPSERLAQLEASGEVTAPTSTVFEKVKRSRVRGKSVSSTLLSDRG
ncbi:MAG: type II toxin-antitoxin system prevent-host-death family antitoxin [Archangium sp.]|nr:type II toxin-antitoxin system prevent-host-death family antitoxin [Archangium sp.]MDP3152746.1 type II toxin-antitoxin system prevent-host-death family antitoxin [Archangium sp.]MDP3573533.1 type II toxin-antitoxin system prevent-host-death family antitoxin [Archangium sp.]